MTRLEKEVQTLANEKIELLRANKARGDIRPPWGPPTTANRALLIRHPAVRVTDSLSQHAGLSAAFACQPAHMCVHCRLRHVDHHQKGRPPLCRSTQELLAALQSQKRGGEDLTNALRDKTAQARPVAAGRGWAGPCSLGA